MASLAVVGVLCGLASSARAWPLLPARPVPNAIAGPADPHPAAIFYNPAALGPIRGLRLWWDNGARVELGSIRRNAGEAAQAGRSSTILSPSVDGFLGLTWDLFTDRVVLGVGVLAPFNELTRYADGSATRYHAAFQRGATLEEVIAVGLRISSRFYVGASANFAESWIDYGFSRDLAPLAGAAGIDQPSLRCNGAPCGLENPLARQDLRVRGFGWGIGFSVGILARPVDRVWLALAYTSHVFDPFNGIDLPLGSDTGAEVQQAAGSPDPGCGGPCRGRARVNVLVPDIIAFAIRIEATPRLEIEGSTRWVHYGGRRVLDIYLQGGNLDRIAATDPTSAVPSLLRIDRGWRDAFSVGASLRVKVGERLRLSPSASYESNASDNAYVSAASLEGHKLDVALTLEWRPRAHLTIGAHVGGTGYFVGQAGEAFDPRAAASCVDAAYALPPAAGGACGKLIDGAALSSAAGRYTMGAIHAGFAIGMDY